MSPAGDRGPEESALDKLVQETAQAWKRMSLYPAGHPARAGALDRPYALWKPALAASGELTFGVARDGLMAPGRKLTGPGALDIAQALYLRNVAVVRFRDGLTLADLEGFLSCLRQERGAETSDDSFEQRLEAAGVESVVTEPVDYSSLLLTEGASDRRRKSSLWDRILRAKLGTESLDGVGSLERVLEWIGTTLARGDGDHRATVEIAEVLAAALEEYLAEEEEDGGRHEARELAELLRALPDDLRRTFLDLALARMTSPEAETTGLEDLAAVAPASEMLASLRRLRDAGHRFSERALRLVQGLVAEATGSRTGDGTQTSDSLQDVMASALAEDHPDGLEDVEDFLLHLPEALPEGAARTRVVEDLRGTLTPSTLTQSLLAVILGLLERDDDPELEIDGLVDRLRLLLQELVLGGRVLPAVALVQHLRELGQRSSGVRREALERILARLTGPETASIVLRSLVEGYEDRSADLAYLVEVLGPPTGHHILIEMCETEDRGVRRQAFDFVHRLGARIVPEAVELLRDSRWYVVRNMLQVLQSSADPSVLAAARRLTLHADARVRLEAAKLVLRHDASVPASAIERLLQDESPAVVEGVMAALGRERSRAAVAPLVALATRRVGFGGNRSLRIRALRCLGEIGDPGALPDLKRCFSSLGSSAEERRAAYASLAGYPAAARAALVERGLSSRDPEVRALCAELARRRPDDE